MCLFRIEKNNKLIKNTGIGHGKRRLQIPEAESRVSLMAQLQ